MIYHGYPPRLVPLEFVFGRWVLLRLVLRLVGVVVALLTAGLLFWPEMAWAVASVAPHQAEKVVAAELRESLRATPDVAGDDLGDLARFYRNRNYRPLWVDDHGTKPGAVILFSVLKASDQDGLDPAVYGVTAIADRLDSISPQRLTELERILSLGFIRYARHMSVGRAVPIPAESQPYKKSPIFSSDKLLALVAAVGSADGLRNFLAGLAPSHPAYFALRKVLVDYRRLAIEGWPTVPTLPIGPTLRDGMTDPRVPFLRRRLRVTGELTEGADTSPLFDESLVLALKRFQNRHGLEEDGAAGPRTIVALNVPIKARLRQIIVNMERWRQIPADLGANHLLINIPAAEMEVVENGKTAITMRVVVGRPTRQTPVFGSKITTLVLNPVWNVPRHLAVEDVLIKVREDGTYLNRQGLRVFTIAEGSESSEINPSTVDWSKLGSNRFPYRLRQDAGPRNAMGKIKFLLPNLDDIYLHDTPQRSLFLKARRAMSSGCIRLEKPLDLAVYVLRNQPEWTREKIEEAIEKGGKQSIPIKKSIPVYFTYMTAWVAENGKINFSPDLYDRDKILAKAIFGPT